MGIQIEASSCRPCVEAAYEVNNAQTKELRSNGRCRENLNQGNGGQRAGRTGRMRHRVLHSDKRILG